MGVDLTKIKTFLLCGHAQSGKTSIAEALLFKSGTTTRLGKVEDGTAVSDYEDDEKERKSSVNLSLLHAVSKGTSLQIIDTPGYLDFIGDLVSASRGADFAVMVINAAQGIEVGTEKAWEIITRENIPCMFFVNNLDKDSADYAKTVKEIRDCLTKKAASFCAIEGKETTSILSHREKNESLYSQIVEIVAESDDALLEKYLETGALENEEMIKALKKAIVNAQIFPVMGGSVAEDMGIEALLEFLVDDMPGAARARPRKAVDGEDKEVELKADADAPLVAQVFKTVIDPFIGQLNLFRVFSGSLSSNSEIYNVTQGHKEKFGQIFKLQGKQQVPVDKLVCGQVGAVAKLKDTNTEDVLCDSSRQLKLAPLEFPVPCYSASVKPKTRQDEEKISSALARLTSEDPTCQTSRDAQTHEMLISGMGELHLQVIIARMKRKYGADVDLGTPKVPYRETISKKVKVQGRYKKQTGGHGQFGDVWIEVEPLERGKDFEFVDQIVGGAIPRNYIPSVEKGIRKAMGEGFIAGFPLSDIKVTLFDGSYHPVDSSDMSFQIAGSMALRKALEEAAPVLTEPIMDVEITVPEEFMGQVTGDINSRRGRVQGMEMKGKNESVKAQIPLAEMFKYASNLRSVTGGRGNYTMSFSHYEIVPSRITQTIVEQAKAAKQEE